MCIWRFWACRTILQPRGNFVVCNLTELKIWSTSASFMHTLVTTRCPCCKCGHADGISRVGLNFLMQDIDRQCTLDYHVHLCMCLWNMVHMHHLTDICHINTRKQHSWQPLTSRRVWTTTSQLVHADSAYTYIMHAHCRQLMCAWTALQNNIFHWSLIFLLIFLLSDDHCIEVE